MKLIKDTFFVMADQDANKTIKLTNGESLYVDTDYNPYLFTTRIGMVTHAPHFVDDQWIYDIKLKNGDKVLLHQFVCQDDMKIIIKGKTYFRAHYHHIFAVINEDSIKPLENFLFIDPIEEKEEDLFKGSIQVKFGTDNKKGKGIVKYLSNHAIEVGIKEGDLVHYTKNAEYKMDAFGKTFYRMRVRNITLIERDGELICMNNKVVIKEEKEEERLLVINKKEGIGKVAIVGSNIADVSVGDKIGYYRGLIRPIDYKGEKYFLLKKDNINYIT